MAINQRPAKIAALTWNRETIMQIYAKEIYERETSIVQIYHDAHLLRFWRLGLIYGHDRKIGVNALGPYKIVVAYADVQLAGPWADCPRRVAYLNCAGAPDHLDGIDADRESDNLLLPSSFRAGEPLTVAPAEFGLPVGGPLGNVRNTWTTRLREYKASGDKQSHALGLSPLHTSVERWGKTYSEHA
jgi:hypothetical protein